VGAETFELDRAHAWYRRAKHIGLGLCAFAAAAFMVGAVGVMTNPHFPADQRVPSALVFVGGAAFIGTLPWNPLFPAFRRARRAPRRLVLEGDEIRLELAKGDPVKLNWTNANFRLSLWTWPPSRAGEPKFTVDVGEYAATDIGSDAYRALEAAADARHCGASHATYRMPFRQGLVRSVTYGPANSRLPG
jgi:hypothetical protein